MSREEAGPDFVTALARGLEVLRTFSDSREPLTLSEMAVKTGMARATVRRIIITLEHLGYVRGVDGGFTVTPRVLELGTAHTLSSGIWDLAQAHLAALVKTTNQAASIAELDGSDVFYVARVAVPKMVSLAVSVGMRLPAEGTALGKVLLAYQTPEALEQILATPPRSPVVPFHPRDRTSLLEELTVIRSRGWALSNEDLHPAVRSVAAPLRNANGTVFAAINIAAVASEVSLDQLIDDYLPLLLKAASDIGADQARITRAPQALL